MSLMLSRMVGEKASTNMSRNFWRFHIIFLDATSFGNCLRLVRETTSLTLKESQKITAIHAGRNNHLSREVYLIRHRGSHRKVRSTPQMAMVLWAHRNTKSRTKEVRARQTVRRRTNIIVINQNTNIRTESNLKAQPSLKHPAAHPPLIIPPRMLMLRVHSKSRSISRMT